MYPPPPRGFIVDLFPLQTASIPSPNAMATDFNGQWKNARTATDEAESVRTLTKILSSKEGRTFVFNLDPQDATFCIEILDHVSPLQSHSHPPPTPPYYPICPIQ